MSGPNPPAVVHVDLDGAAAIYRVHGWKREFDVDPLFVSGLENALTFFEQLGLRATLFTIADDLDDPAKRPLLEDAVRRGHEIGSHSQTHRRLTSLTADEKRAEIAGSRSRLEEGLGVPVLGFRAPEFDIDAESVRMVAESGYRFDSSVFPNAAFARRLDGRRPEPVPHRPLPDHDLVELPMPGHAPLPFPFHPCYSLVLGQWYFRLGLRRFRRGGGPLVVLFHLTDFAEPMPDRFLPGWKSRIFTLSHLGAEAKRRRCEHILDQVAGRYDLVSTGTLLDRMG